MKAEVVCTNTSCPTVRETGAFVQLLPVDRVLVRALDEEGNAVECGVCSSVVTFYAYARSEAQFALGQVVVTEKAKRVLGFNSVEQEPLNWAEPAAEMIRRHVSGDHGSAASEIVEANREAIANDPLGDAWGQIVSVYIANNELLWVVTTRDRRHTYVELPQEYGVVN